jgi:hypothetical protein
MEIRAPRLRIPTALPRPHALRETERFAWPAGFAGNRAIAGPEPFAENHAIAGRERFARPERFVGLTLRGKHLSLVCRGTIHAGDRDVIQAQVHSQLSPVVNQVIHHDTAKDRGTRHGQDGLAAIDERPDLMQMFVGRSGNGFPRLADVLVKSRDKLPSRICYEGLKCRAAAGWRQVQGALTDRVYGPTWKLGHVTGKAAKRHGLLMRLPGPLVFRQALEQLARVGHFLIELRE